MDESDGELKSWDELAAQMPGYDERYESLKDVNQLDTPTIQMLGILIQMGEDGDILPAMKAAYILGAYNEHRGLHSTKH